MFDSIPLHPAIVHLPIGIMMLLPLVTLLLSLLVFKMGLNKKVFLLLTFMHLTLVGASYAALETGEDEEHTVEKVVSHNIIHEHEEKAEAFMIGAVASFVVSSALVLTLFNILVKPVVILVFLCQMVLIVLGYRVGHSGGELVYVHGAAEAYRGDATPTELAPPKENSGDEHH